MISITNIDEHACAPTTPVRDVLRRIDTSPYLFQIVVDKQGRLLGTVTDGDIRRGMLHGISLDCPVSECMHRDPVTGVPGDNQGNRVKLATLGSTRSFLPVVGGDGVVCEILEASGNARINNVLVMAGGPGTRLGELTKDTPKPLLPVGGRLILDHVVGMLEDYGVRRIAIAVHYLAEKVEHFVNARQNRAEITLVREPQRLGTAGALGLLQPEMAREPILVVNGDVITGIDIGALCDFHSRHGFDATIAVARHEVDVPFGVVSYGDDGEFVGIDEKPRITNFVAAGFYYLGPEFIALVPENKPLDMPELLNIGKQIGLKIGLFPIHEYWIDVGRPHDLREADTRAQVSSGEQ